MISVSKLGYSGISAPIGAIEKTLSRVGYTMARRSVFRSLAELESNGFFVRSMYRVGPNRFSTIINFVPSRFEFWTKKPPNVVDCIKISHTNPQVPNWQEDPGTKITPRVNSCNISKIRNKPRARAGVNKIHPVLYTLKCVLSAMRAKDRKFLLARASYEIESAAAGVSAAGLSGALWDRPSWRDMPIALRESICRREILPALRDSSTLMAGGDCSEFLGAILQDGETELPIESPRIEDRCRTIPNLPPLSLSLEELEILSRASSKMKCVADI
jgi:hypothetical protein